MTPSLQPDALAQELLSSKEFFDRSSRVLDEADSNFRPQDGMMTAAQQVAHAAHTVNWFVEGASRPEGFDLNFEEHARVLEAVTSLSSARQLLDQAYENAVKWVRSKSAEELAGPLPAGPIMGGMPITSVISAIQDHSAHHRGALTVYSRLLGKVPVMPYGDT
jgi:uncharacterized damage-inducible protein DinB